MLASLYYDLYYSLKLLLNKTLAGEQSEGRLTPTDQETNFTKDWINFCITYSDVTYTDFGQ